MKKLATILSLFALVVCFQSCEKTDLPNEFNSLSIDLRDEEFKSENFGNPTTGNFMGVLRNKAGTTLEGVQITIGNATTTTDRNGRFIMNDVPVFEKFAYIKAEKTGYLNGSRMVVPKPDGVNNIEITLLEKEVIATINSGEASEVSINFGAKVLFSGNFVTENGDPYTGSVDVVAHYLPANSLATFREMPGNLFAQTTTNSARSLETYGMVSIDLFSSSGQELNIDENHPATVEFPILSSQSGIAPQTMKLWSFDEEVGYWKEEGEAIRQGNKYIAEVSHFSWWNCDIPMSYVELCFSVTPTNTNGNGLYRVAIQRNINDQLIFSGFVTSGELECGFIPRDEEVKVSIWGVSSSCSNQLLHQEVVGGFSMDSSVDIAFEELSQTTQITGTVTSCDGSPLSNGYVYLNGNEVSSITDGIIDLSVQHCTFQSVTLQIFDFNTNQYVIIDDVGLSSGTENIGSVSTCEDTGGIYNGNVTLRTQNDVNSFGLFNYSRINGTLIIGGNHNDIVSNISDLTPLAALEEVSGTFHLVDNELLTSLDGLQNLTEVFTFRISSNDLLTSFNGLDNLSKVNTLFIGYSAFENLDGLQSISGTMREVTLYWNENLTSISGLGNANIDFIFAVEYNPLLTSLEGMNLSNDMGRVEVQSNDLLTDLSGLEALVKVDYLFIGGNDSLTSLDGLENLNETIGFFIGFDFQFDLIADIGNPVLEDLCAVQNLFTNGTFLDPGTAPWNGTHIEHNMYNPSIQDIIDGNCSL